MAFIYIFPALANYFARKNNSPSNDSLIIKIWDDEKMEIEEQIHQGIAHQSVKELNNKRILWGKYFLAFPAAWLKFKIRSKSDFDLTPKNIAAWVYWGSAIIDKISWQESVLENAFPCNNIPKIPSKTDHHFMLYYHLPLHVDFGKYDLSLRGIIEFDSSFGRVTKNFIVSFDVSENKWNEAVDKWKEEWKSNKTIINLTNL